MINFLRKIRRTFLAFGKLLIVSSQQNPKRRFFQYLSYFIIAIILNVIVGKNLTHINYPWYSNVSVFLLVNINIILLLVLMILLFRNLAKLLSEAHSNIFGSRLKVKLVIFSIAITVAPVTVIFFFASTLINDSINKWFNSHSDNALTSAISLVESYQNEAKEDLISMSMLLSDIISNNKLYNENNLTQLSDIADSYKNKQIIDAISLYNSIGNELFFNDKFFKNIMSSVTEKNIETVLKGNNISGYEFINNSAVCWAGVPVYIVHNKNKIIYGAVFSYKRVSDRIINNVNFIFETRDKYRESKFFSVPVKNSYFMFLMLMSLLVVFSGIWGSLFFAKGITKPIEALADASVEISHGNLGVEVKEQGGDEISYLIRTFNRMAKQLNVHTKELHNKNEILSEMYNQISRDKMYIDAIFKNVDSALLLISSDKKPLKKNSKADLFLTGDKSEMDKIIKEHLETFLQSNDIEFSDNIELLVNDEKRIFAMSLSKILSGYEEQQILVVISDITDIVNSQRISVWKEVAARIAHEVKNPLTPIKLMAERIKKRSVELKENNIRDIIQESMDTIITEADNLLELVEEFNLFARLPKPKNYPVIISDTVNEILSLYTETYPNIKFHYNEQGNVLVKGDRHQLRRVFQNIINNAISAMNQCGVLTVNVVELNGFAEIKISDTGTGIKHEDIPKIFEPYFSKSAGGTGLGLAIVKKIIEEHSGSIKVYSSEKGTIFTILLPMEKEL